MKFQTIQTNAMRVWRASALIAGLSLAVSSKATVPISDLPDFDNLPNFAQLGNNLRDISATINGNSGVSDGGSLTLNAGSTIDGDLYIGNGASATTLGTVTGTTFTGQDLTTEQNTVFTASEALSALTPDETISTSPQTASLSFDIPDGQVYVVNLDGGLSLSGGNNITVTGGGVLVLNVSTRLVMTTGSFITGPDASNIFINYLGANAVNMSTATVNGQLFIPSAAGTIAGGVINGGIFSGNSAITLTTLQTINAVPVPEPCVLVLMSAGCLGFMLLARRLCVMKMSI